MKNEALKSDLKGIVANKKAIVTKGDVGGCSIEVVVNEPIFEDLGSYVYKSVAKRNSDFDELETAIKEANG